MKRIQQKNSARFQKKRKTKKDLGPEIIFDSRVGKTDALFVDEPAAAPAVQEPVQNPEFKIPEIFPDPMLDSQPQPQENPPQDQKKKWWQKLFKI